MEGVCAGLGVGGCGGGGIKPLSGGLFSVSGRCSSTGADGAVSILHYVDAQHTPLRLPPLCIIYDVLPLSLVLHSGGGLGDCGGGINKKKKLGKNSARTCLRHVRM